MANDIGGLCIFKKLMLNLQLTTKFSTAKNLHLPELKRFIVLIPDYKIEAFDHFALANVEDECLQ